MYWPSYHVQGTYMYIHVHAHNYSNATVRGWAYPDVPSQAIPAVLPRQLLTIPGPLPLMVPVE